jgi:hypothetical protein
MALPERTYVLIPKKLPKLPKSWSELSWQQLQDCWQVKMRYGGNQDVARAEALLILCGLTPVETSEGRRRNNEITTLRYNENTGEATYLLRGSDGTMWQVTPRELSQMAKQALPWFDYPYGDPGEDAVKDDNGKVVKEARDPVRGYVSGMRDALILPKDEITIDRKHFALPQVACNSLTWQQYRSLQAVSPQLFAEGISESDALDLQAQFLAHCLTPRSLAILDTAGGTIRLRPHHTYQYDTERAERMIPFWRKQLDPILFHICFQCYQTALSYYAKAYPLLFSDSGKQDPMKDALQGEVGTINTIMKYAGYAEQQQVYDSNLPFVLDILNTMAKEAKEIEQMNARIKSKRH